MHRGNVRRLMARRITDCMRGMVIVLVAAALTGFLFDTAVHSVHHLDSDDGAPPCWVALIAGSLGVATPAAISLDPPARPLLAVLPTIVLDVEPGQQIDVPRDRAPPASPLA